MENHNYENFSLIFCRSKRWHFTHVRTRTVFRIVPHWWSEWTKAFHSKHQIYMLPRTNVSCILMVLTYKKILYALRLNSVSLIYQPAVYLSGVPIFSSSINLVLHKLLLNSQHESLSSGGWMDLNTMSTTIVAESIFFAQSLNS